MPQIGTYVALGDSFTEGVGDPYPDDSLQGWADRFARDLAAATPGLRVSSGDGLPPKRPDLLPL